MLNKKYYLWKTQTKAMKLFYLLSLFLLSITTFAQTAGPIADTYICDERDPASGVITIDLSFFDPDALTTQSPSSFNVSYYETQADADSATNQLMSPYTIFNVITTLYARVEDASNSSMFATTPFTIIIVAPPVINITGDLEICTMGSSTTTVIDSGLSAAEYSFVWSLQGNPLPDTTPNISISAAGDYTLTATPLSSINCSASEDFTITAVVCPDIDSDNVADSDEDINGNGNLNDDDTDNDLVPNYQDDDDDGDGILTLNEDYNGNGDPTDDDTDNSGIADYLEMNVALSSSTINALQIGVYPNPTADTFKLDTTLEVDGIMLVNLKGQSISTGITKLTNNQYQIDAIAAGVYTLRISFADGSSGQARIIKR